jgi:sugar transferase (PEP-CTERM/EpsH1 system associated)
VKILLISPWFPLPAFGGALIRVFETLRYLSRHHRVTLLAPVDQAPRTEHLRVLAGLGVEVVGTRVSSRASAAMVRLGRGVFRGQSLLQGLHYYASMAREVQRLTAVNAFDVIHVEHSFMAPYLDWVSPRCRAKTVLSMHNIEALRFRRELRVARWGLRRAALAADAVAFGGWEERAVRRFDGIAAVSPLEQSWATRHAPAARVALVPNGVSLEQFRPVDRLGPSRTFVFSGLMNYPPNVDAVVWFCEAVLPRLARRYPDVRFTIVGDKPTPAVLALGRRPGVEVVGRTPDVRPYLAHAAAAVVPVRAGAGTRLKILEAMAMERPVVATRLGAEGLAVTPGGNILIGDSAEEFAEHLGSLLEDPGLAANLGREGARLARNVYDWRLCFRSLDDLYGAVLGPRVVRSDAVAAGQ